MEDKGSEIEIMLISIIFKKMLNYDSGEKTFRGLLFGSLLKKISGPTPTTTLIP